MKDKIGVFKIKTLVEMFDECQLENIISGLKFKPEKIVFVGYKALMSDKKRSDLEKFFKMKNMEVELEYRVVERFDFEDIIKNLNNIVINNEDCVFDLTGGQELVLTAMGVVAWYENIPMIQFDIKNDKFIKVRNCEMIQEEQKVTMSIKEGVALYGGAVEEWNDEWFLNSDFKADLDKLWRICGEDCSAWNKVSWLFAGLESKDENIGELSVRLRLERLNDAQRICLKETDIFKELADVGLITNFKLTTDSLSFKYKSNQVKKCITKAGNLLELYTYMLAKEINTEKYGFYDDIGIGVCVDWDGVVFENGRYKRDTKNEIDVFLMKDLIPVFISCKNGEVQKDALYELSIVAEKFGGQYSKKILLATTLSSNPDTKAALIQRGKDMGIKILDNVHKLSREEFKKALMEI